MVVAAGSGTRFGGPKQFAILGGRPVARWSVEACRSVADGVVVVVPRGGCGDVPDLGADVVVTGGATRSGSVRAGLEAVPAEAGAIVVHDAARPMAPASLFRAVVGALEAGAAGAVCSLPVSDTLKAVDRDEPGGPETVRRTLDRSGLVSVQTPQGFVAEVLRTAHRGEPEATDDAALVEAVGAAVWAVPGDPCNLKLTSPTDLAYAEFLLARNS